MAACLCSIPATAVRASKPTLRAPRRSAIKVHAQLPAWAPESTLAKQAGAAATAAALWASLALGAGAADLSSGEEVFTNNCAACHTGGANVVQAEKTLQKDALVQYLDGGFKVESIVTQVTNGKNAMPAWADRLSEDEIQDVAAYVFNQASNSLW